ncbi:hypothetical protein KQX54_011865 [Cotesia glomerata]|uniref:Uncharacterized protein n=1 Tax=Cotesia glomerata TaxID=32391 RepID=A0AAV7J7C3_COTGL|nr:hypothetical protein KQX54_011865 [Cotesia glomerata]
MGGNFYKVDISQKGLDANAEEDSPRLGSKASPNLACNMATIKKKEVKSGPVGSRVSEGDDANSEREKDEVSE